jgi:hypothetical protein
MFKHGPSREFPGHFALCTMPESVSLYFWEATMDDKDKSLFENFADTIKHTFDVATDAAKAALEPEPLKPDEELVVVPTSDAVGADFMAPMPPVTMVVKKKRRKPAAKRAKKAHVAAAKKAKQAKKSAKTAAKKTENKSAKKSRKAVKKTTKKVTKKAKTPGRVVKKKKKAKRG